METEVKVPKSKSLLKYSLLEDEVDEDINPLQEIVDFNFSRQIKTNYSESFLLFLISSSTLWLYETAAVENGVLGIIGLMGANFIVSYNISKMYTSRIKDKYQNKKIKNFFIKTSNLIEMIIFSGAIISTVPLTLAGYVSETEAQKDSIIYTIAKASVTQISNSFINTLPITILLSAKIPKIILSLTFFPLYCSYLLYKKFYLSTEEKISLTSRENVSKNVDLIKSKILLQLEMVKKIMLIDIKFSLRNGEFHIQMPDLIKNNGSNLEFFPLLKVFSDKINQFKGMENYHKNKWYNYGGNFFEFAGNVIGAGHIAGYVAANNEGISNLIDNQVASYFPFTITTIIFTTLGGYFSGKALRRIYETGASFINKNFLYNLHPAWKIFPKFTLILLCAGIFIAWHSTYMASDLVDQYFKDENKKLYLFSFFLCQLWYHAF